MTKQLTMRQDDPRVLPAYSVPEAARYLRLPEARVRSWVARRKYPTSDGNQGSVPVLDVPQSYPAMLSFVNLVEAYLLSAIPRERAIPLQKVREPSTPFVAISENSTPSAALVCAAPQMLHLARKSAASFIASVNAAGVVKKLA